MTNRLGKNSSPLSALKMSDVVRRGIQAQNTGSMTQSWALRVELRLVKKLTTMWKNIRFIHTYGKHRMTTSAAALVTSRTSMEDARASNSSYDYLDKTMFSIYAQVDHFKAGTTEASQSPNGRFTERWHQSRKERWNATR